MSQSVKLTVDYKLSGKLSGFEMEEALVKSVTPGIGREVGLSEFVGQPDVEAGSRQDIAY